MILRYLRWYGYLCMCLLALEGWHDLLAMWHKRFCVWCLTQDVRDLPETEDVT